MLVPRACDVTMAAPAAEAQYSAIVLGATGNVGGRIVQLLIKNPLCKKVVVVTRRKTDAFSDPKVSEVVVNMERLGEDVAPHAQGVDIALVAFGVLGDPNETKRDPRAAVALARTNFVGAVSVLTILGERLRAQGHGTIVLLSSVAGERARRANYPYGATKAGIDAFAQGLGDALADDHVHVMVVRPGFVRTKMTAGRPPTPLTTDPDAVAKDIVAGLERRAHTVWSPRALRWVFMVVRHLPRPLFRRLRR